ncbi:MAG: glycosyltransferase family 4 protein [Planctomycetales bacterium]|nr:glycosyltransferase family 4 protein [Planctomycetales bacterium]
MKVAYLTAGAAGMYCGSCLRDNTIAKAMRKQGVDVQLLPTYTPIRTDEEDASHAEVFFGGVNVFLQQKFPLFRYLPKWLDGILDRPGFIRWATKRSSSIDAKQLGGLTLSMLQGSRGFQRKEVIRLCDWFASHFQPDVINFTNFLIGGCIPDLTHRFGSKIVVTLQGDDIFLESLPEKYRLQCIAEMQRLDQDVDAYLVFSEYYRDFMVDYLKLPVGKFRIVPLGIDPADFLDIRLHHVVDQLSPFKHDLPTIGYMARLAHEKGLHILIDAYLHLRQELKVDAKLLFAGWLGAHNQAYVDAEFAKLRQAGFENDFAYLGTVDRQQKTDFMNRIDVLSVPTVYREPKGLFVLEAMAAAIPVVQPEHGAFGELISATRGGLLCQPNDPIDLAKQLERILTDHHLRHQLAQQGRAAVLNAFHSDTAAERTIRVFRELLRMPT